MPYPDLAADARDLIKAAFATLNQAPGHDAAFEQAQIHLAAAYRALDPGAHLDLEVPEGLRPAPRD